MNTLTLAVLATTLAVSVAVKYDGAEVSAELATQLAREIVRLEEAPAPKVVPGQCPTCGGTGKLGDRSSVVITCHACGGTGRTPVSVLAKPKPVCKSGRCPL